jgi:hypothetical protein
MGRNSGRHADYNTNGTSDGSDSNIKENNNNPFDQLFNYCFSQPRSDKKTREQSSHKEADMLARAKLYEIEQLLAPFCLADFIQQIIDRLTQAYRETGDCSILDEALEGHRKNILKYYCKS